MTLRDRLRARRAAATVLCALALAGCGPDEQTRLGLKSFSQQVVFGSQATPTPAPPAPAPTVVVPPFRNPAPDFPSVVHVPPPPSAVPLPQPTSACPAADPLATAELATTARVEALPVPGRYEYRNEARSTVDGNVVVRRFTSSRTVENPRREVPGNATSTGWYDVVERSGTSTVTSTYKVVPAAAGTEAQAGLFLTQVVRTRPDGGTDVFAPATGILIAPFPLEPQLQWQASGTDPLSRSSITFTGTAVKPERVDACGRWVLAWTLELEGQVVGADLLSSFTSTVRLATQYGGLSVGDSVTRTLLGSDEPQDFSTATISQLPGRARG